MKLRTFVTWLKSLGIIVPIFFLFYLTSCSKENNLAATPLSQVDTTITDSTIFIDITLNGYHYLGVQNDSAGVYYWNELYAGSPVDGNTYGYNRLGSIISYQGRSSPPGFAFGKGNYDNWINLYYSSLLPTNFVDSFFAPGSYGYSKQGNDTTYSYLGSATDTIVNLGGNITNTLLTPGINIMWQDSTGKVWETFKGTADQTGSYFNIISVSTVQVNPLECLVTASFACKLYDDYGDYLNLTNGRFRLKVIL